MNKTDLDIQRDVVDELTWEPAVNAEAIAVKVRNGIVILSGHVSSFREKTHAQLAAQRVFGVKGLVIDLVTNILPQYQRSDAEIAAAARNTLDWLVPALKDTIRIMVEKGVVTISGEVDWAFQQWEIQAAVGRLSGIISVHSNITVRPDASKKVIKTDIEAALRRATDADSQGIEVSVMGSTVTLTGEVHSWAERLAVTSAACRAPGVTEVLDRTSIVY